MDLVVPFVLDQVTPIPERLDPSFVLDGPLLETREKSILVACRGPDCSYVVKKMTLAGFTPPGCYTRKDAVRKEILLSGMAARLGVGPGIHAVALNDQEGILVMDRYDGTLEDLIDLYQKDQSIPIDQVVATVGQSLQILHQNGIVHRDFHPGNIFYTRGGKIAIADYELSLFSDSEPLRQIDRYNYEAIRTIPEKIRSGRRFEPKEAFVETHSEVTAPHPEINSFQLLWNGQLCPDFI